MAPLYSTYSGRGKAPHRPDLMLASVLFELRCGKRQPSQWHQDTHETYPLWWLGFGIQPSRSCWYEFRERAGAYVDTLHAQLLHQAVEEDLTTAEYGALDGSAVAANASRRRLINDERLQQRLADRPVLGGNVLSDIVDCLPIEPLIQGSMDNQNIVQ